MMTTLKNEIRSSIKIMIVILITLGATGLFIEKSYAQTDSTALQNDTSQVTHEPELSDVEKFDSVILRITRKLVAQTGTEKIVFNTTGINDSSKASLLKMYNALTREEKAKYPPVVAEIFKPIPYPKKQSPTMEQMTALTDPKVYGVWLDGKRIQNTQLVNYEAADIAYISMSRLLKNAAHYGQYKFDVYLMTHSYFEKSYPPKSN